MQILGHQILQWRFDQQKGVTLQLPICSMLLRLLGGYLNQQMLNVCNMRKPNHDVHLLELALDIHPIHQEKYGMHLLDKTI